LLFVFVLSLSSLHFCKFKCEIQNQKIDLDLFADLEIALRDNGALSYTLARIEGGVVVVRRSTAESLSKHQGRQRGFVLVAGCSRLFAVADQRRAPLFDAGRAAFDHSDLTTNSMISL
jgi:hypothetical protein